MSGGKQTLLGTLRVMLAALPLLAGSGVAAAERDAELARRLEAIVHVHAQIPPKRGPPPTSAPNAMARGS